MTADELRPLLQNAGVRPLTVYANGKALRIAHPEFAALSPNGETLIVFHKDNAAFDFLLTTLENAHPAQRKVLRDALVQWSRVDHGPVDVQSATDLSESLARWRKWHKERE